HSEFTVDSRRAPRWILANHPENQVSNFLRHSFPPKHMACSRNRAPIKGESCSMPSDHSARGGHEQSLFPTEPEPLRENPEELFEHGKARSRVLSLEHGELFPKNRVFEYGFKSNPRNFPNPLSFQLHNSLRFGHQEPFLDLGKRLTLPSL